MSGHTELERNLRELKRRSKKLYRWWRRYVLPFFRLREIKGVLIGQHFGPLAGARVTLNGWRTVITNTDGSFRFRFVMRPTGHLTLEWHEAELREWIEVRAVDRVTELKLKWPLLIRGQVVDTEGEPVSQLPVTLNQSMRVLTDAHGTFIFPQNTIEDDASYQLLFEWGLDTFLHHFKPQPNDHILHRFMIESGQLYHLEDRPSAQAMTSSIERFTRQLRLILVCMTIAFTLVLTLVYLSLESAEFKTSQSRVIRPTHAGFTTQTALDQPREEGQLRVWSKAGLLERIPDSEHHTGEQGALRFMEDPPPALLAQETSSAIDQTPELSPDLDEPLETKMFCREMEFTYLSYIVPRGMEGLLLSFVFGSWQSWREISTFNNLRRAQLQAGQRIKLTLPLHGWSRYHHQNKASWKRLLERVQCLSEDPKFDKNRNSRKLCEQLIQAWNPHVYIRRLRRGDQLLINDELLRSRPFERATINRIEKLRRVSSRRRKRPRIKLNALCELEFSSKLGDQDMDAR